MCYAGWFHCLQTPMINMPNFWMAPTNLMCTQQRRLKFLQERDCPHAFQLWSRIIPADRRLRFFDNIEGVESWIDRNVGMGRSMDSWEEPWPYVFREALSYIWASRNKILHDEHYEQPTVHSTTHRIFERVGNIRLAWFKTCNPSSW